MPQRDHEPPRLRTVTVRFPDGAHALIEAAARDGGVSFAAYVREAALMRWAYDLGKTHAAGAGERDDASTVEAIRAEIRRALGS